MNINIYGSTGEIGKKTLKIISKSFPDIRVNLLCGNTNINLILKQIKIYKPNYVHLNDTNALNKLKKIFKKQLTNKTKILTFNKLKKYLNNSKSDFSVLAISGYKSLYYLENIIKNTSNLGIVNKEAIVSAGHIFKNNKYFKKTNIFPLDSEHYSLFETLNNGNLKDNLKKIIITASGGPFFGKNFNKLKNVSFKQAINHPKWKMGYKNSIDSATLVNKCLEIIEAHYLFSIPYEKIDILIHPKALVHSIIEKENYTTQFNLFKNDMIIPLHNFLMLSKINPKKKYNRLYFKSYSELTFYKVDPKMFPIINIFKKMDKSKPSNLIKFNVGNEYAVNMFKNNLIKYTDIYKIIKKVVSFNLYSSLKTIKDVIKFHEKVENKIKTIF